MNQFGTVAYHTLGCKLNFSETSTIARSLEKEGFAKIHFDDGADIYVINTCSVTEQADKKCRNIVRKALSFNPNAKVFVIGCYAQLKPKEISTIEGVDFVLGANEKFNISKYLTDLNKNTNTIIKNDHIKETNTFIPGYSLGDRTRSFLKIQDGCNYFCSFCTIPLARGKSRSGTVEQTILKAKELATKNVKEVVLTGVNIGDFGQGTKETFLSLIQELDHIKEIDRFRISSIEPDLLNNKIINFVNESKRFVPHFHIPLQSGSDKLLKKMRRRYNTQLYRERIDLIKKLMPNACIGADVIVGFPGETDREFKKTLDFLIELPLSYLHVFTYSERANTTATRMNDVVPVSIRKQRSKQLRNLSEKKKRAFYISHQGANEKVVFEKQEENGVMFGFTSNYIKVKTGYNPYMINQTGHVKLTEVGADGIMKMIFTKQEKEQKLIHEIKIDK
jgi:threonylcarbamoyladenosine tRNA methylthiotransferase MtaB